MSLKNLLTAAAKIGKVAVTSLVSVQFITFISPQNSVFVLVANLCRILFFSFRTSEIIPTKLQSESSK